MRLSFCLPYIEYPNMRPTFDDSVIKSLNVSVVENRPEAPWIKRNSEGMIFTENILANEERPISSFQELVATTDVKSIIL